MKRADTVGLALAGVCICVATACRASPTIFEPIYPRPGAMDVDIGKPFTFPAVPPNSFCDVTLSESKSFDAPLATRRIAAGTASLDVRKLLSPNHEYHWQIVCRQLSDTEPIVARTAALAFKTGPSSGVPGIALVTPADKAQAQPVPAHVVHMAARARHQNVQAIYEVGRRREGANDLRRYASRPTSARTPSMGLRRT